MVFNDILLDYKSINNIILYASDFAEEAEKIILLYSDNIKSSLTSFYKSTSNTPNNLLASNINNCISSIHTSVLHLNSTMRSLYKCISLLEAQNLSNKILSDECNALICSANESIDIVYKIVELQLDNSKKQGLYNDLLNSLNSFLKHYNHISLLYKHIENIEYSLYEPLPNGIQEEEINQLEIKSYKECFDFNIYTKDLENLSEFLMKFELLKYPGSSHIIFTRRIESGSLRIVLGSKEVELSCISDLINTLVNAIKTFAFLPSDLRLKQLEEESKRIENDNARVDLNAKKLTIINSNIDYLIEKLGLDKDSPEDKEKIQLLCIPLIDYLNSNPIGSINGISYDLSNELLLLEKKSE